MIKQLRDLNALIKRKSLPSERITKVELTPAKTIVSFEFPTSDDAAALGTQKLADGTNTQKLDTDAATHFRTEVTFRSHLFIFVLTVPRETSILAQS